MTRYFYRDPLAAAWMEKNHSMKFTFKGYASWNDGIKVSIVCGETNDYESIITYATDGKYYIHPDSLHLLEPQAGDMDSNGSRFYENYWLNDAGTYDHSPSCKIIQRNGIAFMWPEREE